MDIKLVNIQSNFNKLYIKSDNKSVKDVVLYFSYGTLVGIQYKSNVYCITNLWGQTTGKHLNDIEPDKDKRLSAEEFNKKVGEILGGTKLLDINLI